MKSKSLEILLAHESGRHADMVTRFQSLRDFRLLSKGRGRNAEYLAPDEIVAGILSMVSYRPGLAATTAIGLRGLQPAGAVEDAFAQAPTLAAALAAALVRSELLATLIEVRLGDSDPAASMATSAEISYSDSDVIRRTQYVPATATSLFFKGKEIGFDRHSLNKHAVAPEVVLMPRLLEKIARAMKDAEAVAGAATRLEAQACVVAPELGYVGWPGRDASMNGPLTAEMIEDAKFIASHGPAIPDY